MTPSVESSCFMFGSYTVLQEEGYLAGGSDAWKVRKAREV